MLQSRVSAHFQDQAARLLAGDLRRISQEYSFPLPIHFPNDLAIAYDPEARSRILEQRRAELVARGVVALKPTITAMELPRSGRFRVWIDWKERTHCGTESPESSAIYYCCSANGDLRTEMIQYTHVSLPGQPQQQDRQARSA